MLSNTFLNIALFALFGTSHAAALQPRTSSSSNVTVVTLSETSNSTGGEGNVAASGNLSPFGGIGIGCGINWEDGVSFGGGLQAGSEAFGLGGGYKITPDAMEIGTGIGLNPTNASANFEFKANVNGTFELTFTSTKGFVCAPASREGKSSIVCKTID